LEHRMLNTFGTVASANWTGTTSYSESTRAVTSVLTATFQAQPTYAGIRMSLFWILLELMMMEVTVTTGAITRAKLQSNHHHQQTKVLFLMPNTTLW